MKDTFNSILNNKNMSLTESEHAALRNELHAFMVEHPAQAPFFVRMQDVLDVLGSYAGYFDTSFTAMRLVPAAFALVLVIGIGTSYAAENAVPGDLLYPVKLNINEAARGSLAVSQSAKADWSTQLMTRRLEEAETLAAQDRLTPVARAEIQSSIIQSADTFDASVQALAKTEDGATAAASAQSNLEATLNGHEQVLAALSRGVPAAESSIQPILATVRAQADQTGVARQLIELHIAASGADTLKAAALDKKAVAEGALEQVRTKVSAARKVDDTKSTKAASVSAFSAEQAITAGDQSLKNGEYGQAFSTFQAAIRTAQSAQVHLDASERLKTDLTLSSTTQATSTESTDVHIQTVAPESH